MGDYENAIARILRERQQQDGMPSYRQIAKTTGISVATVDRIFNARRDAVMMVGYLGRICAALGLSLAEVMNEAEGSIDS